MFCLLLAACSSSPPAAKSTATTVERGAGGTTTLPGATPAPFHRAKNAHADVKVTGPCTQSDGSWVLKGTVTNPSSNPTGFTIVVDYIQIPGNTVFDTQIVKVPPVDPNHTVPWTASWKYANNDVTCVVRQSQKS